MKYTLSISCILFCFLCTSLSAAPNNRVSAAEQKQVAVTLEKLSKSIGRKIPADEIKASPVPGILQVVSDFNILYISKDGKYLFSGELIDVSKDKASWSLTEEASRALRKKALAAIDEKDMIIFPATAPKIGAVTVFTDIDCHYCRKLQEHIKDYTDAGIEIRYLAFPRGGPGSASFDKAITVWCSTDRPRDLTLAKQGKELPKNLCKNNPVKEQFELGRRMGVNGTPTLILDNGAKLGGIMEVKELVKLIKEQSKP